MRESIFDRRAVVAPYGKNPDAYSQPTQTVVCFAYSVLLFLYTLFLLLNSRFSNFLTFHDNTTLFIFCA